MSVDGRQLDPAEYADLVARVRGAVAATVPPGSSVLVVSKGDAALLAMPGLTAAHFPQNDDGEYAGHHPQDSATATVALEELRRQGAEYLVIPATARWWLEYYAGFATHLATHGRLLADDLESCLVYGLGSFAADAAATAESPAVSVEQIRDFLEHLVSVEAKLVVLEEDAEGLAASLAPLPAMRLPAADLAPEPDAFLAELERLALAGGEYLVVPRSADEWLDRRAGLSVGLEDACRKVADQRHLCRVFELADMRGLRR